MSSRAEPRAAPEAVRDLPGLLVDPSWLKARLGRPGLRTVDLRGADTYATGHIPGAVPLDLDELGSTVSGCENVLLPPAEFSALMAARGVSTGDVVVAYDDQWGLAAARFVWALHRYGHEGVAVLNGGWDRWEDEGGRVAVGEDPVPGGRFEAVLRAEVYADTGWIVRRIDAGDLDGGDLVLLDTRTPAEFERGHLPGAVVRDWFDAVPTDSWEVSRDPGELLSEWRALGVDPSDEVVVYCGSGMRAAHTYLVLRNAGFARVRLYDGSWQEWSMRFEGADGH